MAIPRITFANLQKKLAKKNIVVTIDPEIATKEIGTIKNAKSITLYFKGLSDISHFDYIKDGKNLVIVNKSQRVTINNYFSKSDGSATKSLVKTIRYDNPDDMTKQINVSIIKAGLISTKDLEFLPKKGVVTGTVFSDTINKSEIENPYKKAENGLTINADYGNDDITGTQFNDTISGGYGKNTINFDFSTKFGKDKIKLTKTEQLNLAINNSESEIDITDLTYTKKGNNLIITRDGDNQNQITINNFFKGANIRNSAKVSINNNNILEYFSSHDAPKINIYGSKKISGSNYADTIYGSVKNDTITAGKGNDFIYTSGGKDTLNFSGNFGHDIVESNDSSKVTFKLKSFNTNNFSVKDSDNLLYSVNESTSITYNDFITNPENSADLWIKSKKKTYHVINTKGQAFIDNYKNKKNNVFFLTNEDGNTYNGAKSKKGINVVYSLDESELIYNGGKETYISQGDYDNGYDGKITKTSLLKINDYNGDDTLNIRNKSTEFVLFFDMNSDGTGKDLFLYNKNAMSYSSIAKAVKSGTYTGAFDLVNYFTTGKIENIYTTDYTLDTDGWASYVKGKVSEWLTVHKKSSVREVFLKGSKSLKKSLLNVFKNATYKNYIDEYNEEFKQTLSQDDLSFGDYKNSGLVLVQTNDGITVVTDDDTKTLVGNLSNIGDTYYAQNDSGLITKYKAGESDSPILLNEMTFNNDNKGLNVKVNDNSQNTFTFTDKKYDDFYTKSSTKIAYNAGDPLIKKTGNDIQIGDNVTIKDVDGLSTNIKLIDKEDKTKTIITGIGEFDGTFESEIIVGSNVDDVINSKGGNDLIYLGKGNDVLNIEKSNGTTTGNNTAEMTGIGGTHTISNNLPYPAISVYSESGNDTYNTSLDFGLYIEDYAGNDTLNITTNGQDLCYIFDVVNPKFADSDYTFYEDLFICDKSKISSAIVTAGMKYAMGIYKSAAETMESMQGQFGYAWIDDYYGNKQTIETINIFNSKTEEETILNMDYNSDSSDIASVKAAVANWLSATDYKTAWSVLEGKNAADMAALFQLFTSS